MNQLLSELGDLGEQKSGRILLLASGSSCCLPQLITASKDDATANTFPMQASAEDLNPTKFRMGPIYSSLPTDLETADEGLARFYLFVGGSTTRSLGGISCRGFGQTVEVFPQFHYWGRTGEVLLCHAIYQWMKNENEALLKPFFVTEFNIAAVWDTEWEKSIKPCPYHVVQRLVGDLERDGGDFSNRSTLAILRRLADNFQIVLDMHSDLALIDVYPRCVLEVAQL